MNPPDTLLLSASLDRPLLTRGQSSLVHLVVELSATSPAVPPPRPPLALVLAIDSSGSMEGEKLRHVVASLEFLVQQLAPQDQLGVLCFSNSARILLPLVAAEPALLARVRFALERLHAAGGTNVEDGLRLGSTMLGSAGAAQRKGLLLLSDGQPNIGAATAKALATAVRSMRPRVSVSTLGYGADHAEDILTEISEAGGGTYAYVPAPELCRVELARAVGAHAEVVAEGVSLALRPARVVRIQRVLGARSVGGFGEAGLEVPLGDFYTSERRPLAFALQLEPYAEVGSATVGQLRLTYRPTGAPARTTELEVTAEVAPVGGTLEPAAHALRLLCSAKEARADATRLAELRRFDEARALLGQLIEEIRRAPTSPSSAQLSEALEQLIDDRALMQQHPDVETQRAFRRGQRGNRPPASPAMLGAAFSNLPRARLIIVAGAGRAEVPLRGEMVLGRTAEADLQLSSGSVSRQHTRIVGGDGAFWVSDLGSSNGTLLNGVPIRCERLNDGDLLQLGEVKLLYREVR